MLGRRTHRFVVQTRGLTEEQAAQLMFLVCSAADSFDAQYRSESTVPMRALRRLYPEFDWSRSAGS